MKFPKNYTSANRKIKKFIEKDELHSGIDLFYNTIKSSNVDPILKAKANGLLQSFHVNELAATRKLLTPEDNRKMLRRNLQQLMKATDRDIKMSRFKNIIPFAIAISIIGLVGLLFFNSWKDRYKPLQNIKGAIIIAPKSKAIFPKHIWEAEIREKERAEKKKAIDKLLVGEPIYAVNEYQLTNGAILTPKNGVRKKNKQIQFGICLGSFDHKKNAENFAKKYKSTTIKFFNKNKKYRVFGKIYYSEQEANKNLKSWKKRKSKPWVVKFQNVAA